VPFWLTTVLISASAFLLACLALYFAAQAPLGYKRLARDFDTLQDQFDEWKDAIRVALGRASRMKRAINESHSAGDGATPVGGADALQPTPDGAAPDFLTPRQRFFQNQILARRSRKQV